MNRDPDLTMSRELLDLAMAIADGRAIPPSDSASDSQDPALRANLRRLAALAAVLRKRDDAAPAPRRWGHLEIGEALGSGSFGRVYGAWDSVLQRAVALKLRRDDAPGMDAFAYIEEARRLARVRHPNVLAVHGADVHDGEVGLWSDLIHGETLESVLARDGPLPPARLLPLAEQLAAALAAVHAAGLVHGDVKTANVMLDEGGAAILMDFGAGADASSGESRGIGSPLAMAPERLAGAAPQAAADCYALGVLFFRLLSARYPVEASDLDELRAHHHRANAPSWKLLPRRIPKSLRDLLEDLLARDPGRRPDANETTARLARLRAAPRRRRRNAAIVTVIAALGIGLVAAGAGYLQARDSEQRALTAQAEAEAINQFLRDILASPRPTVSGRQTLMTEVLDQANRHLIERFSGQPRLADDVRAVLASSFGSLGDHEQAARLRETILDHRSQDGSTGDPATREIAYALANNYVEMRRFEDAERLLASTDLGAGPGSGPPSQLRIIRACVETALALWQGEPERAYRLASANWASAQSTLSPYDSHYALSRHQLGKSLYELGRFTDAQPLLEDAVAESVSLVGDRHARTLLARQLLTAVEARMGHLDRAEALATTNLDVAASWLGETDRWTINAMSTLSNVRGARGAVAEAVELNTRALAASRIAYGEDHPNTLILLGNQASKLEDIGRVAEAETLWEDGIERMRRVLGENDKMTLTNRGNLAELWFDSGRAAAAEVALRDIVPRFQEHYGVSAIGSLHFSDLLGKILTARGAPRDAVGLLTPGLDQARATAGMQSPHAQDLLETLATAEVAAGMHEQALGHWRELHALRLAALGAEHPETRAAAAAIAALQSP